jgi:signal transduction histidine kinase
MSSSTYPARSCGWRSGTIGPGSQPHPGAGLTGLSDRIEAVGGRLEVTSPTGGGATLLIEISG